MNLLELCNLQGSLFLMILGCGTETARDHQQGRRKMSDGSLREYRDSLQYCEIVPDFI